MVIQQINNEIYRQYGDRWYTAQDDPVALLRAESKLKTPWVLEQIRENKGTNILDVGCGGGLLTNALGLEGLNVTGVDISPECLDVARQHDLTRNITYLVANAYQLPFLEDQFDVVTAMDFLEHVERPDLIIEEIARVLKPNGVLLFHTINRNLITWFIVLKLLPFLVKNTPSNMHLYRLFITPKELTHYCTSAEMQVQKMIGIRPVFSSTPLRSYFTGIFSDKMRFKTIKSLIFSYMGSARKNSNALRSDQ